eukprot:jgi/Chlat1/2283/Chrsp17S02583
MAAAAAFQRLQPLALDTEEALLAPIPLGPAPHLVHGKLQNGLTYYVRSNPKPKNRAALALAVRVGSVAETEEERGVAHIVEHLAFSATESYENHDLVKFLESIGAEFGACQNAYTSADETVFELFIPIDKPGVLKQAFSVLAEFSTKVRASDSDLEKERGAVLEEWRAGRDSRGRLAEAHWKLSMDGSRYAERLPIGLEKVIRNVSGEVVRAFYHRWYRPENMAVVAIGDFPDPQGVLNLVEELFGSQQADGEAVPIPSFGFPQRTQPRFSAFVDHEATETAVLVNYKAPRKLMSTIKDYQHYLASEIFQMVLNQRFFKICRQQDAPFYSAVASTEDPVRPVQAFGLSAVPEEGKPLPALKCMLMEVARIRLHGVSERELAIAKSRLLADMESAYLERDQSQSTDLRDEYLQHFLREEPVPGIAYEAQLAKTLLPAITRSEVATFAQLFRPECNCVVKTVSNQRCVTEAELAAVLDEVKALEEAGSVGGWAEDSVPDELVSTPPAPGKVEQSIEYSDIGVREVHLNNGMRICFKPTDFLDDQVLISGYAFGGLSELPKQQFQSASMASAIAGEMGVYGFKPAVLSDMLAGKRCSVGTSIGAYKRTFGGDCSPSDLETALQLLYLLFSTKRKAVEKELKLIMRMTREGILASQRNPFYMFSQRVKYINYGNCYYFKPLTVQEFDKIDPHYACQYFDDCFRNPAEFTVLVVGPPPRKPEDLTPLPFTFPDGILKEDVRLPMVHAQGVTQITFPVELTSGSELEDSFWTLFMCRALETRLLRTLRFKYGEIYTVTVSPFFGGAPPRKPGILRGDMAISFTCDPQSASKLVDLALNELEELQHKGPLEGDVKTVVELDERGHEMGLQENGYWLDLLTAAYQTRVYRGNLSDSYQERDAKRRRVIGEMSSDTVRAAICRLLPNPCTQHYTVVTLLPQLSLWHRSLASLRRTSTTQKLVLAAALTAVTAMVVTRWVRQSRS